MIKIETKFGTIYMEEWVDHHRADREDQSKIKLFDSEENYLDYWESDSIIEGARNIHQSPQTFLKRYMNKLRKAKTIEELFECFGIDSYTASEKPDDLLEDIMASDAWSQEDVDTVLSGTDEYKLSFIKNQFCYYNRIGKYHILITENFNY